MLKMLLWLGLALFWGQGLAEVKILQIFPGQVSPGGLLAVKIQTPQEATCSEDRTNLRIWIGSHTYEPQCEKKNNGYWWLTFSLPEIASLLPLEGKQTLLVLPRGERPEMPGAPEERNVEILPPQQGVLVWKSSSTRNFIENDVPQNLSYWFPFGLGFNDPIDSSRVRDLKRRLADLAAKVQLERVITPTSRGVLLPPEGNPTLCDSAIYGGMITDPRLQAQIGLLIGQAKLKYHSDSIIIAPDTGKQPPADTFTPAGIHPSDYTNLAWKSIGLENNPSTGSPTPQGTTDFASIHVIDTFDPRQVVKDAYAATMDINGETYLSNGHGALIDQLISKVAPRATNRTYLQACGLSGVCQFTIIAQGLCAAAREAKEGKRVIVNLSFATPYEHPLLRLALLEAQQADVAVVTAYGNNDRCAGRRGGSMDYCNAYPADWSVDHENYPYLYSVGASQQGNSTPQYFERGQTRWTRDAQGNAVIDEYRKSVASMPELLTPASFWLVDPYADEWQIKVDPNSNRFAEFSSAAAKGSLRPYWGTSFAVPLVTGALAVWLQKCAQNSSQPWPNASQLMHDSADPRLYLPRVAANC